MANIKGQVLDPKGRPVTEASVYFTASPVALPDVAQLTDEDGRFSLTVSIFGIYRLAVRSDEWGVIERVFEIKENLNFVKLKFKFEEK